MRNAFEIKDLGKIKEYLGMEIEYDKKKDVLTLSQARCIDRLLKKFNMVDSKVIKIHIENKYVEEIVDSVHYYEQY